MREIITLNKHRDFAFVGCSECTENCCKSFNKSKFTTYDFKEACEFFPTFIEVDTVNNDANFVYYWAKSIGDECYYLKDNRCSIYDKKRPYSCKQYPFGFYISDKNIITYTYDKNCVACKSVSNSCDGFKIKFIENENINTQLYDNFLEVDFIKSLDFHQEKTFELINELIQNKLLVNLKFTKYYKKYKNSFKDENTEWYIVSKDNFNNLTNEIKNDLKAKGLFEYIKFHIKSQDNMKKILIKR